MIVLSYIVDSHACVNVIHIIEAILDACVYTISSVHFNSDTENSLCRSVHFWFVFVSFPFVYNLLLFRGGCCLVEVSRFITTAIFLYSLLTFRGLENEMVFHSALVDRRSLHNHSKHMKTTDTACRVLIFIFIMGYHEIVVYYTEFSLFLCIKGGKTGHANSI